MEAHKVVRRRGSHIYLNNRLKDGGEVSALRSGRPLPTWKIPVTHWC
jgi:hypothetical protein